MIRKIALRFFYLFAGKRRFQPFFEKIHKLSLFGMNIGGGAHTESSGELAALEYINENIAATGKIMVFDVGANVGHYANLLHRAFETRAVIHSFEPSARTFKTLEKNTAQLNNISRHNIGFGATAGKLTLYTNADESGLASVYQRELGHVGIQMDKTEEIAIATIDGFCSENKIDHIHLLKIDVEGHEMDVLNGAAHMLKSGAIDFIQFEFGGCNIDSKTYFRDFFLLLQHDYIIYRIVRDGLFKIDRYREIQETFITTNYLAERKARK